MGEKGIRTSLNGVSSGVPHPQTINIERYKRTRYWAVWLDGQLLTVTVYKKGAVAIKEKLLRVQSIEVADRNINGASD